MFCVFLKWNIHYKNFYFHFENKQYQSCTCIIISSSLRRKIRCHSRALHIYEFDFLNEQITCREEYNYAINKLSHVIKTLYPSVRKCKIVKIRWLIDWWINWLTIEWTRSWSSPARAEIASQNILIKREEGRSTPVQMYWCYFRFLIKVMFNKELFLFWWEEK